MKMKFSTNPKGKASLPLLEFLKTIDPNVQCERRFDWLFLPKTEEFLPAEAVVRSALIDHCRLTKSRHPKKSVCNPDEILSDTRNSGRTRAMEVDFYLPFHHVGIEFDERQHFTIERQASLAVYPNSSFPYDTTRWSSLCSERTIDCDPPGRDWQRAFRDSVRDIRAQAYSLPLLRLYHKDFSLDALQSKQTTKMLTEIIGELSTSA
jgi:hypothetical protein